MIATLDHPWLDEDTRQSSLEYRLITIRLGFLIIYLNQSREQNLNFYSIVYSMAAARLPMHNGCK
jgi:hypothetical protein